MRIVAISDMHGQLPKELPNGDVLVICGDIMPLQIQFNVKESYKWIEKVFVPWCHWFSFKKVLFIGGNHDICLEGSKPRDIDDLVTYMENSIVTFEGVSFYGFPYIQKTPRKWAFDNAGDLYDKMPNADVLICHDTPYIKELLWDRYFYTDSGNSEITKRLDRYRYVFCGHWHEASKVPFDANGTMVVNCSLLNDDYRAVYEPFVIDIN